jgi:signal peptidase I
VAVAGDTVEMENTQLVINGEVLKTEELYPVTYVDKDSNNKDINIEGKLFVEKNGEVKYEIFLSGRYSSKPFPRNWAGFSKMIVPKNHCFVLGDNRNLSGDSRHFGPVPLATVKGRAEYLYWPAKGWSRIGEMK